MDCCHTKDALVSAPDGPFHGLLAHGFACGAHLAVHNGVAWNTLGNPRSDRGKYRRVLRGSWEVTNPAQWKEAMDHLLSGQNTASDGSHIALGIREVLIERHGLRADLPVWCEAITQWCQQEELSAESITHLTHLAGTIIRYEARFRADDLLPPDGRIRSTIAYDFGRAVNMARWGVGALFCDPTFGEVCVRQAGENARREYHSWQDFSAGYILGRVIRFDEEHFSHWYGHALRGHQFLLSEPLSPWRNLPFA